MKFVFALVVLVWIGSAALSKKRIAAVREKDGALGVIISYTVLLLAIAAVLIVGTVIYAGKSYSYAPLDAATVFFFSVVGVLVIELILGMTIKRDRHDTAH